MTLKGYDLSEHQATTPSFVGHSFVVLRASIGTAKDTRYDQHYAAARAAGVVVMAYAYGLPADRAPIADQAATFLSVAQDADFLWLDQEEAGFDDAQAQAFIDQVHVKGKPIGLYHSASGFGGVRCDAKWVADWRDASETAGYPRTADGSKEFPGWTLWQYDGGGADGLDNNYWNPDRPIAELLRKGYVTQAKYGEAVALIAHQAAVIAQQEGQIAAHETANAILAERNDALEVRLAAAEGEIAHLRADVLEQAQEITALGVSLLECQADLAEAPAIERERIAQAEAERIRAT